MNKPNAPDHPPTSAGDPPKDEPGQSVDKAVENWCSHFDDKVGAFERKIPRSVSALLDGVCFGVFLWAACWLTAKWGWMAMPGWASIAALCVLAFLISLTVRRLRRR